MPNFEPIHDFTNQRGQTVTFTEGILDDHPAGMSIEANGFTVHLNLTPEELNATVATLTAIQNAYNAGEYVDTPEAVRQALTPKV